MKIGLVGFNIDATSGDQLIELACLAEALGIESLWAFEHTMVPVD